MALLDFPTGPNTNDTTTQNGNTWKWNGTSWVAFNNLSLSSQVSGILAVQYGGTGFGTYTKGDILYALTSNTFGKLAAGTGGSILAIDNSGDLYWKKDDAGTGSVSAGTLGGFAFYDTANSITSGTAVSFIIGSGAGGTGATFVIKQSTMALIDSTITAGTWAGSAITLAYGGTNNTVSGIGHSYRIAMYDAAGTAITNISTTSGIANSVLFQSSFTSAPIWQGQSQLIVGGATTAAQWQTSRTVTFSGGGVTGSFSINGSADVSSVALNIADNAVALGTKTTGDYAASVAGAGNGLSTIGTAGEGTAFTIHSNATDANTNSTLVFRNSSGNFSAGTITATLSGTATSANAWTNGRAVTFSGGGVTGSFSINGSADVSSVALNIADNAVALGTKTTGDYAASVAGAGNGLSTIGTAGEGTAFTIHSNATDASTNSTLVFRNSSGNFSAGTITATLSGTATKATNVVGGTASAGSSILIQTGVDTTGFLAHPGSAGQALTTTSNGLVYGALTSLAVTSVSAGTAMQVSGSTGAVTITNNGVHSVSGTTNRINVSVSGSGGTGAVTLNLPDTVILTDIQLNGGSSTLSTVGAQPTSMVNKQYVDNLASGLDVHGSVRIVINAGIAGSYYQPGYGIGSSAIGAYITSIGNSTLQAYDGISFTATGTSQRVLITGGLTGLGKTSINGSALVTPGTLAASNLVNGIYYVGSVGSGSSQWYLYRAFDTDDNTELTGGAFTFVEEGSLYKDTGWVCTNDTINLGPIQMGSTQITFSQFSGAGVISFGQGLTQVGNAVASNINLSATGAASAIGYTQFNIGGPTVGGAADTGYYPTFSVRTGTIHAGTSLLTLNHTGFSLVGSTNTAATLTVTGNISLPNPGAGGSVAYSSDANTLAFVGGTSEQILKSNGTSAPSFVNQNTIIAGGAGTAANIQGGAGGAIPYQSGGNTTVFLNNPGAGYALTTVSATSIAYQTISSLSVGSATNSTTATNANNVAVNSTAGTGSSYLVFVSAQTGNLPILTNANVTVDASTSTITATLAGTATTANRVGITTSVGAGTSFLYFGSAASGSAALGATTDIYVNASTGTIIAKAFTGLATTATLANTVGITTQSSAGASYIYFGSAASGSAALGATTTIYVTASTGTIVATNFSGIASSATRVGITTSVGAGTSYLYFGDIASGYGGIGATTDITVNASTGTIIAKAFTGLATTATLANTVGITTQSSTGASYIYFGNAASGSAALGATTDITVNASTGTIIAKAFTGLATTATLANNVGITTQSSAGASYIYFGSTASGSAALGATTTIYVTASTGTIVATNFSGLASNATNATNVGITTHVGAGTSFLYFGSTASGNGALGSTTSITVAANTGTITATNFSGIWVGTAITTGRGGTGLISVNPNQVLIGTTSGFGNTWAAIGSTLLPVVGIGSNPPAQPGGAIGATQAGQLWWDSEYGVLKIYYSDQGVGVTVNSQWVDATPVLGSSGGASSTKRSYVMTFGAGFTPTIGADSVQIQIPYAPDNTSKYYYIKRLDYRSETTAGGSGVTFFIERHTTGNASFSPTFRIHTAGSGVGASFVVGGSANITSYTLAATGASFVSSSGVAGSVISGDYLRLNFTTVGSAAAVSVSMIVEEQ